jgi:protein-disulfide isomerase
MVPLVVFVLMSGIFKSAPVLPPQTVGELDHVRGAEGAALVITVYADFQCPSCLSEVEVVARAWPRVEDKVQLVFRHFPLDIHRHAFAAARYAEAASMQGKFWEMHDMLFINQPLWANLDSATEVFDSYSLQLGLDLDVLKQDLGKSVVRDKILADQQSGIRAGVRGTPSMFFNGKLMNTPRTSSEFISMVNEALE